MKKYNTHSFIFHSFLIWMMVMIGIQASPLTKEKHLQKRQPLNKQQQLSKWDFSIDKAWGANLGNWLILEKWMDNDFFKQYQATTNQTIIDEWTFNKYVPNAKDILQQHWANWITENDFKSYLSKVKANHIRIPIGYWAFIQPDKNEPYIFGNQKDHLVRILDYCATYQIHVILDCHGLPGSQNGQDHSGHKGNIGFYSDYNIQRGLKFIQAMIDWINGLDDRLKQQISAIESANEPHIRNDDDLKQLKLYYKQAYKLISSTSLSIKIPMIFHDGYLGLSKWDRFLLNSNAVIDVHAYWAFSTLPSNDTKKILNDLCQHRSNTFHLPILYGEWSLASSVPINKEEGEENNQWLRQFMDTQVSVYQQNKNAGAIMWSLKLKKDTHHFWSLEHMINNTIVNQNTFSQHPKAAC
ncbi:unnamed protein product [Cunninghamella blakesleeana]